MQTYFDIYGFNGVKEKYWPELLKTLQTLLTPSRLVIFWRNWKYHLKLFIPIASSNHGTSYPVTLSVRNIHEMPLMYNPYEEIISSQLGITNYKKCKETTSTVAAKMTKIYD